MSKNNKTQFKLIFLCSLVAVFLGLITNPTLANSSRITVNKFKLNASFKAPYLTLTLETDLPDTARIVVSVSRPFTKKGNANNYSIHHAFIRTSAGEAKKPFKVKIDNKAWQRKLKAQQAESSRFGNDYQVSEIKPFIKASATLPVDQPDPRFGAKNELITGKAIKEPYKGRKEVRTEVSVAHPIQPSSNLMKRQASLDPFNLDAGVIYIVSKRTPIMDSPRPFDPAASVRNVQYARTGNLITIQGSQTFSNIKWYKVKAQSRPNSRPIYGWINSFALIGQALRTK
jgi:hypothetical protein